MGSEGSDFVGLLKGNSFSGNQNTVPGNDKNLCITANEKRRKEKERLNCGKQNSTSCLRELSKLLVKNVHGASI